MKKQLLHIVIAAALFYLPNVSFAQAPDLGTAAGFVLFTSVGAVGNTGISQLTGNVGTNSGAITGFGNVNGGMHTQDSVTAKAAADLLTAYKQLDTTTATFVHAPLLGNRDTLVAGVYSIAGNTTLNDTLFLNAAGDSTAVFIFKVQGTLSTGANSKVKLLNGAQACNVFWKVEGQVSMASGTTMRGTVIANNAAISMTTNDTLEGRALSTAGAVNIDGVLAYTPTGCGSPLLTGPAAPALGTTACYAIFSGDGDVTNSGITMVTGDIGTNRGLTTGYDSLNVTGKIHPIPDASTAAAAADLGNVYTYLNTLPADIELLYPAQFGRNLVLTPHTYIMKAATTFTDSLYLNAQGDSNAVFVIQINGALSTSTFSKVLLKNGALAKNVFWKVDGAVNIGNNSHFQGTIVANNGAIDLTTGDTLNGRAFTTTGALTTAAIIATMPPGCSNVTLPVSWLYFKAKPAQENVLLEWSTTNEMNNGFFTIEKSRDGRSFETLGTVKGAGETGSKEYHYSFTDLQPYSLGYYRISQTDNNGRKNYFNTIQIKFNTNLTLKTRQYVQQNYIYVQTSGAAPANGSMQLYSIDGKKMSSQKILLTKEVSNYKIEKPFNKGIYLLIIESNGKKLYNGKVMVD
jgi:hypothetical protein